MPNPPREVPPSPIHSNGGRAARSRRRVAFGALRTLACLALALALLCAQRLSQPTAPQPQTPVPVGPSSAGSAAARSAPAASPSAKRTPPLVSAPAARNANQIPGQQFTPAAATSDAYSPERARQDVEVGDFYYRRGDYAGALSRYQGALRHDPGWSDPLFACAKAESKLGDLDAATSYLRRYLTAAPRGRYTGDAAKLLRRLGKAEAKRQAKTQAAAAKFASPK